MYPSKVQVELWKTRARLDRKLARMTPAQQRKYLAGAQARLEAKTGVRLNLRVASLPPRRKSAAGAAR